MGNLSNLEWLSLDANQLSGSIPSQLGNLSNLQLLYLFDNAGLSGPLPSSFTRLNSLQDLYLDGTGLCAPTDAAFQTWLEGIDDKRGVEDCGDALAFTAGTVINDQEFTAGTPITPLVLPEASGGTGNLTYSVSGGSCLLVCSLIRSRGRFRARLRK